MSRNGLMIIHSNHLENLTQVTLHWLRDNPLPPLATDYILVQSNGMADWLKLQGALQGKGGISAAQHYQMPARFLWQLYRWVLGEDQVPASSSFDKSRLEWRLFRLLPAALDLPGFESLHHYLQNDPQQQKLFSLARQLADLYDQYQVYREDWLLAWEQGREILIDNRGQERPLPAEQRWQAQLWRQLADEFPDTQRSARHHVRERCLEALRTGNIRHPLPPRLVIFGITTLAASWIELLAALAKHLQILWLVQNPCQYYWGDSIEDRDLLRFQQRRHPDRPPLHTVSALALPLGNPLLSAWGKQGRDTIGLLYEQDEPQQYAATFQRIDLFDDADTFHPTGNTLLATVQQDILDLQPLPDQPAVRALDHSIQFHQSHSRQREVEVLHDRLLAAIDASATTDHPLQCRDIVIMVPRIEDYAAHIDAVFGRYGPEDERYLPYAIADRTERQQQPAVLALEQLLNLHRSRLTASDVSAWLDVPAFRRRFGLLQGDIPLIRRWVQQAGIRWGLHQAHREQQQVPFHFSDNTWWFGLRRMLLGYALGTPEDGPALWQGIAPYDEVAGLQATVAGKLIRVLEQLEHYWRLFQQPGNPLVWIERFQALLADCFLFEDEAEQALEHQLLHALEDWRQATREARFDAPIDPQVASTSWLERLDGHSLSQRFLVGKINFCTLMPMRNIPFRFIGLLGMNDGDYPRLPPPQEFDLTRRPGQYRPGDRAARDDDRYLLLEALLACRETLYISWQGRSVQDNSEQPPSVLIGQLLDYLDQRWQSPQGDRPSVALMHQHPLQPFSTRYFAQDSADFTYAREWQPLSDSLGRPDSPLPPLPVARYEVDRRTLASLLKYPADVFFRERLKVSATDRSDDTSDDETFALDGLGRYHLTRQLIQASLRAPDQATHSLDEVATVLRQTGHLPVGALGDAALQHAQDSVASRWPLWQALIADTRALPDQEVSLDLTQQQVPVALRDWLRHLVQRDNDILQLVFSETSVAIKHRNKNIAPKFHNLIDSWTRHLLACASGLPVTTHILGLDGQIQITPLPTPEALAHLQSLLDLWLTGQRLPLPMAIRTGTAYLFARQQHPDTDPQTLLQAQRTTYEGSDNVIGDLGRQPLLARAYGDFDHVLQAADQYFGGFEALAERCYLPLIRYAALV